MSDKVIIKQVVFIGIGGKYVQPNLICEKIEADKKETIDKVSDLAGSSVPLK